MSVIAIPRYRTGRLWTRDELVDLFAESWPGHHVGHDDVHRYLLRHFGQTYSAYTEVVPTDEIPFPPMNPPEDGDARRQYIKEYEDQRHSSKRSRQLFDIDSLPKFIPSTEMPTEWDDYHVVTAKRRKIESL